MGFWVRRSRVRAAIGMVIVAGVVPLIGPVDSRRDPASLAHLFIRRGGLDG
jgi:hypothetical protein